MKYGQVLLLLLLSLHYHRSMAEYPCICDYNVEQEIFPTVDSSSKPIGYMYEFDCKERLLMPGIPDTWFAIAFEHKIGYIESNSGTRDLSCQGDPPTDDLVTSTLTPNTEAKTTTSRPIVTSHGSHTHTTHPRPYTSRHTTHNGELIPGGGNTHTTADSGASAVTTNVGGGTGGVTNLSGYTAVTTSVGGVTGGLTNMGGSTAFITNMGGVTGGLTNMGGSTAFTTNIGGVTGGLTNLGGSTAYTTNMGGVSALTTGKNGATNIVGASTVTTNINSFTSSPDGTSALTTSLGGASAVTTKIDGASAMTSKSPGSSSLSHHTAGSLAITSTRDQSTDRPTISYITITPFPFVTFVPTTIHPTLRPVPTVMPTSSTTKATTTVTTIRSTTTPTTTIATTTTSTTTPTTTVTTTTPTTTTTGPVISGEIGLCPSILKDYTMQDGGALTQYGASCFELVPMKLIWTKAEVDCRAKGGNLVHVPDERTQQYIVTWLRSFNFNLPVWLGLNDKVSEGFFSWMSDPNVPVYYTNWSPDYETSDSHLVDDCVVLRPGSPFNGRWGNVDCGETYPTGDIGQQNAFICEYKLQPQPLHATVVVG